MRATLNILAKHSLAILALLIAVSFLSGIFSRSDAEPITTVSVEKPSRPNVLFVLSDDQPSSTISAMPKTMNWFKNHGVIFPNHFVSTPVCCPSRAAFLTGQYGHNSGVLNNRAADIFQRKFSVFDRRRFLETGQKQTVFEQFAYRRSIVCDLYRFGYETAIFGKYVNGWENRSENPNGNIPSCFGPMSWMGFDEQNIGSRGSDFKDRPILAPGSDQFLTDKASEFVKSSKDPWFAFLSLRSPHLPFQPEARYQKWLPKKIYEPSPAEINWSGNKEKPVYVQKAAVKSKRDPDYIHPTFYAVGQQRMVRGVDDAVHLLIKTLKKTGQMKNTIIVFSSDNGYLWADHGLYGKFFPYLDSIRTPLMISYPDKIKGGRIDNRLASNVDFAPTIYRLTNTKPTKHVLDGYNLFSSYRRPWLLTESGANGVTPYWAGAVSYDFHYIESSQGKNKGQLLEESPKKALPENSSEIAFREYYKLDRADGEEINNLYNSNYSKLVNFSKTLKNKAWRPWIDQSGNRRLGCAGNVFSGSKNPCP